MLVNTRSVLEEDDILAIIEDIVDTAYPATPFDFDGECYDSYTPYPHGAGGYEDPHPSFIPTPSPTSAPGFRLLDCNAYDAGASPLRLTATPALGLNRGK